MNKLTAFILIAFAIIVTASCSSPAPPVETHQSKVDKLFSSFDGSHIEFAKLIKNNMNDPESYEHVKTVYWDMIDSVVVKTTVRGNNQYGAKQTISYRGVSDLNGILRNITLESY
jgi:PBP1b-binding outer membrane lipoprotein LpoB